MTTENLIEYGHIQAFNPIKGYGFIRRNLGGKDAFFFYQDLAHSDALLAEGDVVSFVVKQMPKGPRAYRIQKEG